MLAIEFVGLSELSGDAPQCAKGRIRLAIAEDLGNGVMAMTGLYLKDGVGLSDFSHKLLA